MAYFTLMFLYLDHMIKHKIELRITNAFFIYYYEDGQYRSKSLNASRN